MTPVEGEEARGAAGGPSKIRLAFWPTPEKHTPPFPWRVSRRRSVGGAPMVQPFSLSSPAFRHECEIPRVYTCEGRNLSPPLEIRGVPPQTRSLALVVHDPDVPDPRHPRRIWVHWVLYNLPPRLVVLPEAMTAVMLPAGAREGQNDWRQPGYGGPCPPVGRHRYVHTLWALDTVLPDLHVPTRMELLSAMETHVIAQTHLVGTYEKTR